MENNNLSFAEGRMYALFTCTTIDSEKREDYTISIVTGQT